MRILTVLRKSAQVYLKNFTDLMGAYLVEALLRAMCFVPLMFLLLPETAVWALLCVPMYVFIALPARQNYAIAMQDMLYGGRVFSPRLISFDGYWRKLGRGLAGTLKMLLWMALPLLLVTLLVQLYKGEGWLTPNYFMPAVRPTLKPTIKEIAMQIEKIITPILGIKVNA